MRYADYYTYMSQDNTNEKALVESIKKIDKERLECKSEDRKTKLMYEQMLKGLWLQQNPSAIM